MRKYRNKPIFFDMKIMIAIIGLMVLGELNAQIITDRPDQTESSSTVGNGNLQIETGLLIGFEGEVQNSTRQILAPSSLFRYGISKGVELRFLNQFETLKNANLSIQGISDIEIGTKIQILKQEDKDVEVAFLSHLIVPIGTSELTNDNFGTINKVCFSHDLNEKMSIGYNLGYNYFGEDNGDLTYSIALGIGVNEQVGIYIEPYGEMVNFDETVLNFDAGLTYLANENLQFDFSFGTGINERMNYISAGFSWLIHGTEE